MADEKVFEQSDYCRRCGRTRREHVQHRDNRPPHCPELEQPLGDVHVARHAQLHAMLDELVADWLVHTKKRPSSATVLELMQWANEQRLAPTHREPRVRCEHCDGAHQGADCPITYPGAQNVMMRCPVTGAECRGSACVGAVCELTRDGRKG